jgi:hypothetical protein
MGSLPVRQAPRLPRHAMPGAIDQEDWSTVSTVTSDDPSAVGIGIPAQRNL